MGGTSSLASVGPDDTIRITRPDGAEVAADVFAPPSGADFDTPLVILDGIGCAGWAFRRIIPKLRAKVPVVFAYYRGHGKSKLPPRPWHLSMEDLADDAAALASACVGEPACFVGFSLGFSVGLEVLRRHRERVAGLVSVAGPAGRVLDQFQGTTVFRELVPLLHRASAATRDILLPLWKTVLPSKALRLLGLYTQVDATKVHEEDLEIYLHEMARIDPELFLAILEHAAAYDPTDFLPQVDVPTAILAGAQDRFVPLPVLRKAAMSIPGASWQVIPEGTHALPAEHPEPVADFLTDFVSRIRRPRRPSAAK